MRLLDAPKLRALRRKGRMAVDESTRKRIDKWIRDQKRNEFGDPKGTMYAGGTPLFDMRSGKTKDRYEYILDRHPELRIGK